MEISALQWPDDINCAVTVCDINGVIKYMNRRAKDTFAAHGDLIGKNLFECHSEESRAKIRHMLATGDSNAYTISKNGQRKVIYQTPWRCGGVIAGMVEISMIVPESMPHYIRERVIHILVVPGNICYRPIVYILYRIFLVTGVF